MNTPRYVGLLRGINVGGKNIIKMIKLRACLESAGLLGVTTYIQSGNVLFSHTETDPRKLEHTLEECLKAEFGYTEPVIVYNATDFINITAGAPDDFGSAPELYRYDVIFLKDHLKPGQLLTQLSLKEGVDSALAGENALYFRRLTARASSSYLSKITLLPAYKQLTIRNWNTTIKLATLLRDNNAK